MQICKAKHVDMRQKSISRYTEMQVKGSPCYGLSCPFFPQLVRKRWLCWYFYPREVALQGTEISWIKEDALGLNWFEQNDYQEPTRDLEACELLWETVWWARQVSAFKGLAFFSFFFFLRKSLFYFFNFIEILLIYNVVLVSGIQQSDSVIRIYIKICIFFFRFFSIIGYYKILRIVPCAIQ